MKRSVIALASLALAVVLSGCSWWGGKTDAKKDWGAPEYYAAAKEHERSGFRHRHRVHGVVAGWRRWVLRRRSVGPVRLIRSRRKQFIERWQAVAARSQQFDERRSLRISCEGVRIAGLPVTGTRRSYQRYAGSARTAAAKRCGSASKRHRRSS